MKKDTRNSAIPIENLSLDDDSVDLLWVFTACWRGKRTLLLGLLCGILVGITHVIATTPVFTSAVHISIGSPDAENARRLSGISGSSLDEDQITTEIQVLRSEQISSRVVDTLKLVKNDTFLADAKTGPGRIVSAVKEILKSTVGPILTTLQGSLSLFPPSAEEVAENKRLEAISRLRENMKVTQIKRSRILQVSYTSISPVLSAEIANEVADAYIEDQLASKYEVTQRATDWMKERTDQLRIQSTRLDNAIENFRRENNLVGVGGDLSSDTELELLNRQVTDLRADLLALEARSNRLNEIVDNNDTSAFVSSTATQSITANLRTQYLETLRDYNSLLNSLGEEHQQALRRQRDLVQLEELMFEEIKRSEIVARNDVHEARDRLRSLEEAREIVANQLGADNTTLVELRELERNAETVRSLYTSFLQRYQLSLQEQGFPVSNARILNPARAPESQSSPKLTITTALFGMMGLFFAIGWILVREILDNKIRTEDQVNNVLGLELLGGLDRIAVKHHVSDETISRLERREVMFPEIMKFSSDKPLSSYAETLRTAKMSATLSAKNREACQIIGVVSCLSGDGKTVTAANFSGLLSCQGAKVLLIDGDMRSPGLTRSISGEIELGLIDVLLEGAKLQDVICREKYTGIHILPNRRNRAIHTSELLAGDEMGRILMECSKVYDYVIIDLPPLGPVIDARAVLHYLDGLFFVAKWGVTNIKYAKKILQSDPRLMKKCFGVFLNMVDPEKASTYEGYVDYYSKYYDES